MNAHAWYAGFIEFGTIKTAARHVLSRAAESVGLTLRSDKKS